MPERACGFEPRLRYHIREYVMARILTRDEFIERFLNVDHIRQGLEDAVRFHPMIDDVEEELKRVIDQEYADYLESKG